MGAIREKARDRSQAFACCVACVAAYGSWTLSSARSERLVFRPSGARLAAGVVEDFGMGEPPLTGEPDGEALGVGEGDGATVGVLAGGPFFGADSHAAKNAALAARIVDSINDLLIVFSYEFKG